jgi:pimeloyl-ACP methyl ester carboxylesterase
MAKKTLTPLERRAFPRVPAYTRINAHLCHRDQHLAAELADLSVGGMRVRVEHPWDVGTILDFEFSVLEDCRPFVGRAEVARVDAVRGGAVLALRFLSIQTKSLGLIGNARCLLHLQMQTIRDVVEAMRYAWAELHGNLIDARDFGEPGAGFRPPLLLVHGWLGTRGVLRYMEGQLKRDGFPVFSIDLGLLNVRDIRESAALVTEKVEKLATRLQLPRIAALGHSMGGLIALWAVKKLQLGRRIHRLVAVGTPFHGTSVIYAGLPIFPAFYRTLLQMAPGSAFLRELNEGPLPTDVQISCIAARQDFFVAPASATLEGACNYLFDGGHAALITSDESIQKIQSVLEGRDPFAQQ